MSETGGPMTGFKPEDPKFRALKQKALEEIGANEENQRLFWNMIASAESVAKLLKEAEGLEANQRATAAGPSLADTREANKRTFTDQLSAVGVKADTAKKLMEKIYGTMKKSG